MDKMKVKNDSHIPCSTNQERPPLSHIRQVQFFPYRISFAFLFPESHTQSALQNL